MRITSAILIWCSASLCLWGPTGVRAEMVPFDGTVVIRASVGISPGSFQLLSVPVSGLAEIDAGVVKVAAGAISVTVPSLSGFGGTLVNGAATLSAGGGGPGSSCLLIALQEICITGGGFGGPMSIGGVTHEGQALVAWGAGAAGTNVGSTASGVGRVELGTLWTAGLASAFYYIPEIDPTPFAIQSAGTFRGLPVTYMGPGDPGFSIVTPMVVTSGLPTSVHNARAIARLTIDFSPQNVPIGGAVVLGGLLLAAGVAQLRSARRIR